MGHISAGMFLIVLGFLGSIPAASAATGSAPLELGLGMVFYNSLYATSGTVTGEESLLGSYFLTPALSFRTSGELRLLGRAYYSVPRSDPDGGLTRGILGLQALVEKGGGIDLRVGAGWNRYTMSGSGGVVTLNNGNGFADFPVPDGSVGFNSLGAVFGFGFQLSEQGNPIRFDLDGWWSSPLQDGSMISIAALVSMGFGRLR